MGIPSRNGDPRQNIWKALPHPRQEPTPAANGPPPRPAPPGFAPALPGSRRVPSHIGDPREYNRDRPPPTASGISTCAAQVYPTLAALPARFQLQWPSPRAQLGSPPLPPPGADPHCERNPTPPRTARFRPGPAGLPAGSQPHWRPPGAQQGPTPHPQRAESRPVQPRFTPPWLRSRRVSSRSGHLREHNWEALPYPRQEPTPALRRPGSPRPCRAPGALPTFTSGSR